MAFFKTKKQKAVDHENAMIDNLDYIFDHFNHILDSIGLSRTIVQSFQNSTELEKYLHQNRPFNLTDQDMKDSSALNTAFILSILPVAEEIIRGEKIAKTATELLPQSPTNKKTGPQINEQDLASITKKYSELTKCCENINNALDDIIIEAQSLNRDRETQAQAKKEALEKFKAEKQKIAQAEQIQKDAAKKLENTIHTPISDKARQAVGALKKQLKTKRPGHVV